ncbi:MAG: HEAT repeat domain-containing protein [Candidatus Binataceae bacterium]
MLRGIAVLGVSVLAAVALIMVLALPGSAHAQQIGGMGPNSPAIPLQALEEAGPGSLHHNAKDSAAIVKEAKRKAADADPRVRVEGLEKLRNVDSPDVEEMLFRGLADPDVRVRIKAIDVLGARGVSQAVPMMAQELFLRDTAAIEKLHLVAALGRIGDTQGTLPVLEYLKTTNDPKTRGTAVFALGEIGDPRANDALIRILNNDSSPMVRRLAQESLEKIDGELPNRHREDEEVARQKELVPTAEKLSKLREMDAKIQADGGL